MASIERKVRKGRPRAVKHKQATSLRVTPTCLELWNSLASREGLSRTGYLETTIRRLAAKKKVRTEAKTLAYLTAQTALAGPIGEICDTAEEDDSWSHLFHIKVE